MKKKLFISIILGILLIVTAMIIVFAMFQESMPKDIYANMQKNCHPIWKDLAESKIYLGQNLEDVISKHKPHIKYIIGRYTTIEYIKGWYSDPALKIPRDYIAIIAFNGRLVRAEADGVGWDYLFFNEMSDEEIDKYERDRFHRPSSGGPIKLPYMSNVESELITIRIIFKSEIRFQLVVQYVPYVKDNLHLFRSLPFEIEYENGIPTYRIGRKKPHRSDFFMPVFIKDTFGDENTYIIKERLNFIS